MAKWRVEMKADPKGMSGFCNVFNTSTARLRSKVSDSPIDGQKHRVPEIFLLVRYVGK